jgi:hypothetical protein
MEAKEAMIEKNLSNRNILDAIEKSDSCPLCYLWLKSERRHLEYLLTNEVTMDPGFREKVLSAKGFCNRHIYMLYETAHGVSTEDGLGFALYVQAVVEEIFHELNSLRLHNIENTVNKSVIMRWRGRRKGITLMAKEASKAYYGKRCCPVCESLWSLDQIRLHTLIQMLDDKDFREGFKSSRGLCLPHFAAALRTVSRGDLKNPGEVAHTLIELEVGILGQLKELLSEFIRKHDWKFRDEPRGPEIKANSLALNILAGVEGLYSYSLKAHAP